MLTQLMYQISRPYSDEHMRVLNTEVEIERYVKLMHAIQTALLF